MSEITYWAMVAVFSIQIIAVIRAAGKTKIGTWVEVDDPVVDWVASLMTIALLVWFIHHCVQQAIGGGE